MVEPFPLAWTGTSPPRNTSPSIFATRDAEESSLAEAGLESEPKRRGSSGEWLLVAQTTMKIPSDTANRRRTADSQQKTLLAEILGKCCFCRICQVLTSKSVIKKELREI